MPSYLTKIDGTTITPPTSFSVERYSITKGGRTASGNMTIELIARKHKFLLVWEYIDGDSLQTIYDLIFPSTSDLFFELTYTENGTEYTKTVYVGAISAQEFRTEGKWYWKNVSFNLIEQ